MTLSFGSVNWLAVGAAALATFLLGGDLVHRAGRAMAEAARVHG